MMQFVCNICGASNRCEKSALTREAVSCPECRSNVRERGLIYALSMELFGLAMTLPEFPRVKSLRGLGTSDSNLYASRVAEKLDYRNTFYDREPRFDFTCPPEHEFGGYDFLLSSDVLEHVTPPVAAAFGNACRLLKPFGVLIFTVPYSTEAATREHYPDLHEFGFAKVGGALVLVNRTRSGAMQVFENPVFHRSGTGDSLEMREFTEAGLKSIVAAAGFSDARIYAEDYEPYGIVNAEAWSLPIAARKGEYAFSRDSARAVLEEWREFRKRFDAEMKRLDRSLWVRIGRRLGLL